MSRSTLLVNRWVEKYCPGFVAALGSRPVFIHHINDGSDIQTERLFLRSPEAGWATHPRYESILAACTDAGREMFASLSSARSERIFGSSGRVTVGPSASLLRSNSALGTRTLLERLKAGAGLLPQYGTLSAIAFKGKTVAEVDAMVFMTSLREYGQKCGVSFGPLKAIVVEDSYVPKDWARAHLLATEGPGKVFVMFEGWVQNVNDSSPTHLFYCVANRPDDSCGFIEMRDLFSSYSVSQPQNVFRVPNDTFGFNAPGFPAIVVPPSASAYELVKTSLRTDMVHVAGRLLDTVEPLDYPWLPLVAIPRQQEYFVSSQIPDVGMTYVSESSYDILTVLHSKSVSIGAVPVSWYVEYANAEIAANATNKVQLQKTVEDMSGYESQTVTYVEFDQAVMLPNNIVEQTTLYRDYGKAKEKACEDNDFLTKEFAPGLTYGNLQTMINGSRSTPIMYGYRDSGVLQSIAVPVSPGSGVTLTLGSAVVTSRLANGQFGPNYTVSDVDSFLEMASNGATLVGGTIESQFTLWNVPYTDVVATTEDKSVVETRLRNQEYGTSGALYDFRWGSLGISGYPLYNDVDPQTGYRMAMLSKSVLKQVGPTFRKIHLESIRKSVSDAIIG